MIVFVILYLILWIMISSFFYKFSTNDRNIFLFMILQLSALICFLLCVFYSPWNHALQKDVNDTKKKYDKIKENTESTYQNQIKAFWIDALNQQNRYYLFAFMTLTLLPFFYFFFYIISHSVQEIDIFINDSLIFLLLMISLFYNAMILFLYTISNKQWLFITIPIFIFFFVGILYYYQKKFPPWISFGYIVLAIIESIFVFSKLAYYWCLIPLLPFLFTLIPFLYGTI